MTTKKAGTDQPIEKESVKPPVKKPETRKITSNDGGKQQVVGQPQPQKGAK